ncbi:uncharacterized protein EMH_0071900 [Eimeria mitis]|uniref:Uncharacterized protein n=1 Tax=Eimeria mitis TaxID=44415 RepID=U6K5E7_9EIME|nr:uncharacterized protein EMH_0071900 [Eimeria mitis]CDJ32969.1 hypothetical protein, conserved [Eimeria mitis]
MPVLPWLIFSGASLSTSYPAVFDSLVRGGHTGVAGKPRPAVVSATDLGSPGVSDLQGQLNVLVVGFKAAHYDDMNSWIPFTNKIKREIVDKHSLDISQVQSYRLVVRHRAGVLLRWWTDERLRFAVGTGDSDPSTPTAEKIVQNVERTHLGAERGGLDAAVEQNACSKVESPESSFSGQTPEEIRLSRLQEVRSRTLVCFTDKSAFVDALQLADAQRVYIFLLDKEGEISWCEHEQYSANKEVEIRELLQLPNATGPPLLTGSDVSRFRAVLPSTDSAAESRQG